MCEQPVPANAHWKHRDRHVCSPRCNLNLNRRLGRRIDRGELSPPSARAPDPQPVRDPRAFATLGLEAPFPYEIHGYSPKPGDAVERHGSVTVYVRLADLPAGAVPWQATAGDWDAGRVVVAVHVPTGSAFYYVTDDSWSPTSLVLGAFRGLKPIGVFDSFDTGGIRWSWYAEIIRDIDAGGEPYTWTAYVCGLRSVPRLWTPAYTERSERLNRTSRAAGSHAARMRKIGQQPVIDRLDPQDIYQRDGWICQICRTPVDPTVPWPDMWTATLDHRVPLTAGGAHAPTNVQLSHWICNLHKGDTLLAEESH